MDRYIRNRNTISIDENELLARSKVCVAGCGGLGGYVVEMLSRIGVGHITVIDGDAFDVSNLNRQILCDARTLGRNKAQCASERMEIVNPHVNITVIEQRIDSENAFRIVSGHDIIIDALDNIDARIALEKAAEKSNTVLVHGAIAGFFGQVTVVYPGEGTISRIYGNSVQGIEKQLGNPSFTPALVASIQSSEAIKVLLGKGEILRNRLLMLDLLNHDYEIIDI